MSFITLQLADGELISFDLPWLDDPSSFEALSNSPALAPFLPPDRLEQFNSLNTIPGGIGINYVIFPEPSLAILFIGFFLILWLRRIF